VIAATPGSFGTCPSAKHLSRPDLVPAHVLYCVWPCPAQTERPFYVAAILSPMADMYYGELPCCTWDPASRCSLQPQAEPAHRAPQLGLCREGALLLLRSQRRPAGSVGAELQDVVAVCSACSRRP
jgi:hypothetical protein